MITPEELDNIRRLLRSTGQIGTTTVPAGLRDLATRLDFVTPEVVQVALTSNILPKAPGRLTGARREAFEAQTTALLKKIADDLAAGIIPAPQRPVPGSRAWGFTKATARILTLGRTALLEAPARKAPKFRKTEGPAPSPPAPKAESVSPAAAPPARTGGTSRLTVNIPTDIFLRLKVKSVLDRTTLSKMVGDWAKSLVGGD